MKNKSIIMLLVVGICIIMAVVDAVIRPGYFLKSVIKIALFLLIPVIYSFWDKSCNLKNLFKPEKKGILLALGLGVGVYAVVLGAFFLFRGVFDFSALTSNLTAETGVNKSNFLFVALYISFANSLLEEFFFRGFSFLTLKNFASRKWAYIFSAAAFSVYHVAMMIAWFSPIVVILALAGLFAGGLIFNFINEKSGNIYLSWLVHMFANFATNTIGFILFDVT